MKQKLYLKPNCETFEITVYGNLLKGSGDAGSFIDNEIERADFFD